MKLARLIPCVGLAAGLFVMPAAAAPVFDMPGVELAQSDAPAVTVAEEAEVGDSGDDWTFRYLVPTAIVLSLIIVVLVAVGYAVRVRGRYRVTQ